MVVKRFNTLSVTLSDKTLIFFSRPTKEDKGFIFSSKNGSRPNFAIFSRETRKSEKY